MGDVPVGKGLENRAGQNNCFLNVGIQSLWHLLPFTTRFAACEQHRHQQHCVFCALKVILTNYEFSEEAVLPPHVLRETLDALYRAEGKFKLGEIEDAAETLEAILENLHDCIAEGRRTDGTKPSEDHGIDVLDQICCTRCNEISEPFLTSSWIYYVYTSNLIEMKSSSPHTPFDESLHRMAVEDKRLCPNEECRSPSRVKKYLLREPAIFTLDLVWDSDAPSQEAISQVLDSIDTTIYLNKIFDGGASTRKYQLKGMICYYGKHYDAFFYNPKRQRWVVFDDATVKEVGSSFGDVTSKCRLGHFQPSILYFEGETPEGDMEYQPTELTTAETSNQLVNLEFEAESQPANSQKTTEDQKLWQLETREEYQSTKRLLKNCISETNGLLEMSAKPSLQVDSLLANTNTVIDALERRCEQQRHAPWVYDVKVPVTAQSLLLPLWQWEKHVADLKAHLAKLADRSRQYQAAIHNAKKSWHNFQPNDMIETELLREALERLKTTLERIIASHRQDHQNFKRISGGHQQSVTASAYPNLTHLLRPDDVDSLLHSPSHTSALSSGLSSRPSFEVPLSPFRSSIPLSRAQPHNTSLSRSSPTQPRYRWNGGKWSMLEDLSDFLRFP